MNRLILDLVRQSQQQIEEFLRSEIAPWIDLRQPGLWLTQATATRFERYLEREAVAYVEQQALTEAVAAVLGPGDVATPFIVAGLKQVLDAQTPSILRFAHEHQAELAIVGVCALFCLAWQYSPS